MLESESSITTWKEKQSLIVKTFCVLSIENRASPESEQCWYIRVSAKINAIKIMFLCNYISVTHKPHISRSVQRNRLSENIFILILSNDTMFNVPIRSISRWKYEWYLVCTSTTLMSVASMVKSIIKVGYFLSPWLNSLQVTNKIHKHVIV